MRSHDFSDEVLLRTGHLVKGPQNSCQVHQHEEGPTHTWISGGGGSGSASNGLIEEGDALLLGHALHFLVGPHSTEAEEGYE